MALVRNQLTPQFAWNQAAKQYHWIAGPRRGEFAPRKMVRAALDDYLTKSSAELKQLAFDLRNRTINAQQFYEKFEQIIMSSNLCGAALAKGGWAQLSEADYEKLQEHLLKELGYARKFIGEINEKLPLDGRFINRIMQYGQAPRYMYHHLQRLDLIDAGYTEEKSVRHLDDSCSECVILGNKGWQSIGTIKLPGNRICLRNCRCTMEYR